MPEEVVAGAARVERLRAHYEHIARTSMADVPICNPVLPVEAIGFEHCRGPEAEETGWLGVLLTPWFMNLVWLSDQPEYVPASCQSRIHHLGDDNYLFIGSDDAYGVYECCSLMSPVLELQSADAARQMAVEVLELLRKPLKPVEKVEQPSRRRLLFGAGRPEPAGEPL